MYAKLTDVDIYFVQDFLNIFFRDIYRPIPSDYNLVLAMLWRHPENINLNNVKVVHYCAAGSKPWRYTGEEENMNRNDIKKLVKMWWDIYDDKSLDFKPTTIPAQVNPGAEAEQGVAKILVAISKAGIFKAPRAA